MVSMPKLKGVISNNSMDELFPAKISACTAAPNATTSSGFTESFTGCAKNSATFCFTKGTRVLPPTMSTVLISEIFNCASFIARAQHSMVF